MEEENEFEAEGIDEAEYAQGFNWGYVIGEHNPELARDLMEGASMDTDQGQGLYHGINQFFREREQDRANELDELREKGKERGRDLER